MKGKERFLFRPTRGDWMRKWGSVNWHQRQGEIPVRAQSWTDTPDGYIHAQLARLQLKHQHQILSPHTHSQSHWNVIISFSLYVHWHSLTGWKLLPFQTGSGRWVPQQKLNYFYCRKARRGKTTCEGWKSKLRRGKGQPLLTNVSLMHSYGRSCCGMRTYTTSQ